MKLRRHSPGTIVVLLFVLTINASNSLAAGGNSNSETSEKLYPTSFFEGPGNPKVEVPELSGRLKLPETKLELFEVLQDDFRLMDRSVLKADVLPAMAFNVFRDGNVLVPFARGRQLKLHPLWDVTLESGRVWDVVDDGVVTHAVLPISLHEVNEDCTFHGLLKFSLRAGASKRFGSQALDVVFQVASETCLYLKLNMASEIIAEFEAVSAAIKGVPPSLESAMPIAALSDVSPGFNPDMFHPSIAFGSQDLTTTGLMFDGSHYAGPCPTRAGPHPVCDALNLPSYSLAKTLVGTLALLQLEHLYEGAMEAKIADYVQECAGDLGWDNVTFGDALNMATGHYESSVANVDETGADMSRFYIAGTHDIKIEVACTAFPLRATPGTKFLYRSSDFYVLGTALQAFYRDKAGADRDFFEDLIVENLFRPLGLSPASQQSTRTADQVAQPVTYNGLSLLRSDVVKIGQWMVDSGGRVDGRQILDPKAFAAAMQRRSDDRGAVAGRVLSAGMEQTYRYKNGLWALNVAPLAGCRTESWVPFMSGVSGNVVLLFPNGTVYYHFSDGGHFSTSHLIPELHKLKSVCEEDLI